MATYVQRMIGAARLDAATYEEVERDGTALWQAAGVVLLSSVAGGLGYGAGGPAAIVTGSLVFLAEWFLRSVVVYLVGTRLLPEPGTRANLGELLRTLGFAAAPGVVRILGVVPGLRRPVFFLSALWLLAAMVIAVKQALDYQSLARAIAVCAAGWFLALGAALVIGVIFAPAVY